MSGCLNPATKHKAALGRVLVQPANVGLFIPCNKTQSGYALGTCVTGKCRFVHTPQQNTKKGMVLVQPVNVRLFKPCTHKNTKRQCIGYLCNRQMSGCSYPATKHKTVMHWVFVQPVNVGLFIPRSKTQSGNALGTCATGKCQVV